MGDRDWLAGGRVVGEGGFRLDRRKAMEKLARFQLEDPFLYVVELVAAAVRAGAEHITIREDADDFVLEWAGGLHPTREELDNLFDHLFADRDEDRTRMLQHLAQGVHGALGAGPRFVRLERPGLTLDFTDPLAVTTAANDRGSGLRIHVRERLSWKVLAEALAPRRGGYEAALLRERAGICPVPITLNGAPLASRAPSPPPGPVIEAAGSRLWLRERVEAGAARGPRVAVIRDGVVVSHEALRFGGVRLEGWVIGDGLKLDASRSAVVKDEAWKAMKQGLIPPAVSAVVALILARYEVDGEPPPHPWPGAAQSALWEDSEAAAPLASVPVFQDLQGRWYSLEQLRALPAVGLIPAELEPLVERLGYDEMPLFIREAEPTALVRVLRARVGGARDLDQALELLDQERQRRETLRRQDRPLRFESPVTLSFTGQGLRGFAGIGFTDDPRLRVELRVDGLPVSRIIVDRPGPIDVRIDGDALSAAPGFVAVVRDRAFADAMRAANRAVNLLLAKAAREGSTDPRVRRVMWSWLGDVYRRCGPGEPVAAALPKTLRGYPLLDDLVHGTWSLDRLLRATRDAPLGYAMEDAPPAPRPGVPVVPWDWLELLEAVLGEGRLTELSDPALTEQETPARSAPAPAAAPGLQAPLEAEARRLEEAQALRAAMTAPASRLVAGLEGGGRYVERIGALLDRGLTDFGALAPSDPRVAVGTWSLLDRWITEELGPEAAAALAVRLAESLAGSLG